ncbi:MAG TPA: hypothetical protein PKO25_03190 [Spirochaetota bacterium]|nr:hypothetical protein [Spirochaetota bacterium]HNU90856.1 hypothetical protein [Spirochaetota bacterium]HPV97210.1 hypothetical protein [Spirochaetota bacterium]
MDTGRPVMFGALITLALFFQSGCGGLKGEFALRQPLADEYRRVAGVPEFPADGHVDWVYAFREVKDVHSIGVILMKREIVWVDVSARTERIDPAQRVIYGAIEGLARGRYRLLIAENGKIVDEMEFVVFDDSPDEEAGGIEEK